MLRVILLLCCLAASAAPAAAQVWDCDIKRAGDTLRHEAAIPRILRIELRPDPLPPRLFGEVIHKAGLRPVEGRLERVLGDRHLLAWTVKPLPLRMLPRTETAFYAPAIVYRARLNTATGRIAIRGDFVTTLPSANAGLNLRGQGACKQMR